MNSYFDLRDDQKKMVITQTANKIGLPVQAIEKDLWVSTILKVSVSTFASTHKK